MNPKEYEHYEAFTDFSAKDTIVDKILSKFNNNPEYRPSKEEGIAIIERNKALNRLKAAKKALEID